jgi:hypothetical protein
MRKWGNSLTRPSGSPRDFPGMKTSVSNLLRALACAGMLAACNRPAPSGGPAATPSPEAPKVDSPIITPLPPVPGSPMPPPAITPTPTLTPGGTASMSPRPSLPRMAAATRRGLRRCANSFLSEEKALRAHPAPACLAKQET